LLGLIPRIKLHGIIIHIWERLDQANAPYLHLSRSSLSRLSTLLGPQCPSRYHLSRVLRCLTSRHIFLLPVRTQTIRITGSDPLCSSFIRLYIQLSHDKLWSLSLTHHPLAVASNQKKDTHHVVFALHPNSAPYINPVPS